MAESRDLQARIYRGLVVLLFGIVAVNLFQMQIVHNQNYRKQAAHNRQERVRVRAPRGRILDREGRVLADNVFKASITLPSSSISADGPDSTLATLIDWFELDEETTLARLRRQQESGRGRLVLMNDASMSRLAAVEERARDLPGARVDASARRRYPNGSLFAHLIGYTGEVSAAEVDTAGKFPLYRPGDAIGREGVESAREVDLRGQAGWYLREVNARGRVVGTREIALLEVLPGRDVHMTLSVELQDSLMAAMAGRTGCAVALSLPDGAVLAAVSLPTFDSNIFSRGISSDEWNALLSDPRHPFLNRLVQATYPPGSPYKIVTSLSALENGAASDGTSYEPCLGSYHYGNRDFRCWKRTGHGYLDHTGALVHSCDVFYYQVIQRLDLAQLKEVALALGLGQSTRSPFKGETAGIIPDIEWYDRRFGKGRWTRGVMLNNAIGQGEILVTPLQMAVLTGRVASGDANLSPRFFMEDLSAESAPLPFRPANLAWIRHAMGQVVDIGTGTKARLEAVEVAGKTGTAENPHGDDHAWFVGFAPASHPEVAVAIILENAGHGGAVAAPVAARWMETFFNWRERGEEQR